MSPVKSDETRVIHLLKKWMYEITLEREYLWHFFSLDCLYKKYIPTCETTNTIAYHIQTTNIVARLISA